MLEALAVALANPGPRDPSIHAAMCGGVGRLPAPRLRSLRPVRRRGAVSRRARGIRRHGRLGGVRHRFAAWSAYARRDTHADPVDTWPRREHPPGFDPHGVYAPTSVRQLLDALVRIFPSPRLSWLESQGRELEQAVGLPLDIGGIAAAAFCDLGFAPNEGEMLLYFSYACRAQRHMRWNRKVTGTRSFLSTRWSSWTIPPKRSARERPRIAGRERRRPAHAGRRLLAGFTGGVSRPRPAPGLAQRRLDGALLVRHHRPPFHAGTGEVAARRLGRHQLPGPAFWNNRVAGLAGTTRSSPVLGLTAALAISEASIYGGLPGVRAIDFFLRAGRALDAGISPARIVELELAERP